eukprot:4248-Heterococcus_DN1.PRE.1
MLQYLRQQGCEFSELTLSYAAWSGQLAVCQWLVAEQCPYDAGVFEDAARKGRLETIRFLHEQGCPWDGDTICVRAAQSGSVELLQYLKQQ